MTHTLTLNDEAITFEATEYDAEMISGAVKDLLSAEGFVNIDGEDVRYVLDGAERVSAGEGMASGETRFNDAALEAVKNIHDAKRLLVEVRSDVEVTLTEMMDAVIAVKDAADPDADLVWGHVIDENMNGAVKIIVIAVS